MKTTKPSKKADKAKNAAPLVGKKADKKADKKSAKAAAKAEKKAVKTDKKTKLKKAEVKVAKSPVKAVAKVAPKGAAKAAEKATTKPAIPTPSAKPATKTPTIKAAAAKVPVKPEPVEASFEVIQPKPKVEFEKHLTQTMPQPKPQPVPHQSKTSNGNDEERSTYSKEELEEFRQLINEKLTESRDELKVQQDTLKNSTEVAADGYNFTEFGSEMSDREQAEMLLSRTAKFINSLERALVRIENGTYGRCKITGKLIPKERLRMVPHTETSIEAKLALKNAPPMPLQDV